MVKLVSLRIVSVSKYLWAFSEDFLCLLDTYGEWVGAKQEWKEGNPIYRWLLKLSRPGMMMACGLG